MFNPVVVVHIVFGQIGWMWKHLSRAPKTVHNIHNVAGDDVEILIHIQSAASTLSCCTHHSPFFVVIHFGRDGRRRARTIPIVMRLCEIGSATNTLTVCYRNCRKVTTSTSDSEPIGWANEWTGVRLQSTENTREYPHNFAHAHVCVIRSARNRVTCSGVIRAGRATRIRPIISVRCESYDMTDCVVMFEPTEV